MFTEWTTYELLSKALDEVQEYGYASLHNTKIQRAMRTGTDYVIHHVNTPKSKHPAIYLFFNDKKGTFYSFLALQGSEGISFAVKGNKASPYGIIVIHSHAINRYVERSKFEGSVEEASTYVIMGLMVCVPTKDSDTTYISFDDGVFLCNVTQKVLHIRTYITYKQCKPNQRIWLIKSEMALEELKKKFLK